MSDTGIMVQGHCQGKRVERIAVKKALIFGCRFVTVFHLVLFFFFFFLFFFLGFLRYLNVYCIFFETCNMGLALMCLLIKKYVGTEAYYAK